MTLFLSSRQPDDARNIYSPDLHLDALNVKARNFR